MTAGEIRRYFLRIVVFFLGACYNTKNIGYITNKLGRMMIEPILGSENAERTLIYILMRDKGYASEIAAFYDVDLYTIQNQLRKFENGGILVSFLEGRTRDFEFNPRYVFLPELKALLEKAFSFYPQEAKDRLQMIRRRPRRTGKPL
jgi:hypothetical protein